MMYTRPPQQHGVTAELVTALADLVDQLRTEQVRGYRIETVAELLDVSPRTVDTLIRDKRLGFVWLGKYRVVPHAELQRYLAAGVLDTKTAA